MPQIILFGRLGDTGPCGSCAGEYFYDHGSEIWVVSLGLAERHQERVRSTRFI